MDAARKREFEEKERNLPVFDAVSDALDYIKQNVDYENPDEDTQILKKPDSKKVVVAQLDICSYLHNEGYKTLMNQFDIYDVVSGKEDFTDTIEEA